MPHAKAKAKANAQATATPAAAQAHGPSAAASAVSAVDDDAPLISLALGLAWHGLKKRVVAPLTGNVLMMKALMMRRCLQPGMSGGMGDMEACGMEACDMEAFSNAAGAVYKAAGQLRMSLTKLYT